MPWSLYLFVHFAVYACNSRLLLGVDRPRLLSFGGCCFGRANRLAPAMRPVLRLIIRPHKPAHGARAGMSGFQTRDSAGHSCCCRGKPGLFTSDATLAGSPMFSHCRRRLPSYPQQPINNLLLPRQSNRQHAHDQGRASSASTK